MHMICVRMSPEAPTSDPAMMRMLLPRTKPVAAAANPEAELRMAMMTGMSAPPTGTTMRMPSSEAAPIMIQ